MTAEQHNSPIRHNLGRVNEAIANACRRAGRDPKTVTLVAVSKLQRPELIKLAYDADHRDFGENYPQELRDKCGVFASLTLTDIRWHAIGHLQLNKAKYVARFASYFHALETTNVANELGKRRAGEPLSCFLEVNMAEEQQKGGIAPSDVARVVADMSGIQNIKVVGLMCLPPLSSNAETSRPYFREMRKLAQSLELRELSMGTTHDFEIAVEEGATFVRVGTAIFGERGGL